MQEWYFGKQRVWSNLWKCVFKHTKKVALKNGTKARIIIKPSRLATIGRKYRIKVQTDELKEFL